MSDALTFALEDLSAAIEQLRGTVLHLVEATKEAPVRTVTVDDLSIASGLHAETVKKYIRENKLPGYKEGDRYIIPDLEFDAWRRGEWQPRTEPVTPVRSFVRSVSKAS